MNKVTAVNLNGNAFQLEETGYDKLRAYLDSAAAALTANPDRDEILADIEQAIADKFRAALGPHKTVVATRDVERVIGEMGPVDGAGNGHAAAADSPPPSAADAAAPGGAVPPPRRLYLIHEGAMVGGVCNGIAAYFGIDVSLVRVVFALTCLLYGAGILAYILLMFIVPSATTPEQKAAAQGLPKTAQEFIRRAKEGYYQGMKTWGDRRAHREWRRKFRAEMRDMGQQLKQDVKDVKHNWRRHWDAPTAAMAANSTNWLVLRTMQLVFVILLLLILFHHGTHMWLYWHGMPFWLAIVLLVLVFELIKLPFRAGCWAGPIYVRHWHSPLEGLIGLFFFAFIIWLLNRNVPSFHEFLTQLPNFIAYMAQSIHDWWVRNVH